MLSVPLSNFTLHPPTTSWTQRTPGAESPFSERGALYILNQEGPEGGVHSDTDPGSIRLRKRAGHAKVAHGASVTGVRTQG